MKKANYLVLLLCALMLCMQSSYAHNTIHDHDNSIVNNQSEFEDLNTVLDQISNHYEISIIFDEAHVQSIKVRSFELSTSLETDLNRALESTSLEFKKVSDDTYVIKKGTNNKPKQAATTTVATAAVKVEKIQAKGVIYDSKTQETLIGANIIEVSTQNGTISDIDGSWELMVEQGATLDISYIGYKSKQITVDGTGPIDIYLESNTNVLNEVVVVGYGSQKKSDLTGAVSSIGVKELKELPSTGLEQAMQGRSAGVYITQNSGSPGGAMSVRIRGSGSTLTAEPLYVIDGIPIVNDNAGTSALSEVDGGGQYSNALTTINPNDIESIEILKDASATAIYGARAANGVVIITTKRGEAGTQNIGIETYIGVQQLYREVPVMKLRDYASYIINTGQGDIEEFENLELLGDGTDWQDVIFRSAVMHNQQFSLSAGSEKTNVSFTAGLHNKDGIVEGSNFKRYSTKLNINHKYNDRFRMGVNLLASQTRENIIFNDNSKGVIYTALLTPPMVPDRTLDGEFGAPPSGENIVLTFDNPLANALEIDDVNRKNRMLGSIYAELDFTSWLKYRFELATDILYANQNTFYPSFERGTQSRRSQVRRSNNNSFYWINKHLLTFDKLIAEKHKVTFLGGFEAQEGNFEWLYATRENLPTNDLAQLNLGDVGTQQVQGGAGHWALLSYFGRLNYGYDERYLLTSTLRVDGSSRFGPNNKYGMFPSLAFAWRLSNEEFFKQFENLYNAKIRLGYGAVGNQEIGLYSFAANLRSENVVIGNQLTSGFSPDNIANPNVQWESSVQLNLGVDLGFFDNKIEVVVDVYDKKSADMLLPAILPLTAGNLNPPFINIGEMSNRGIEFTLNTQNLTGKVNWKTSANLSFNVNEVVDLGTTGSLIGIIERLPVTRTEEGLPLGQYFGHVTDGIFKNPEEVAAAPFQEVGTRAGDIRFKDLNDDGIINDDDKTFIGSPHPDYTFNLINDISFKNFDFNFFIRGVMGNEVFNLLRRDLAGTGAWHNQSTSVIDSWTPTNVEGSEPRSNGNDPNANRRISDRFVEDGSFLRLQNVSIGYNMPSNLTSRFNISNLRIYVSGQNLATLTGYSGYDPEIGSFNQSPLINGVDNGRFPVARSFTFGVNLNF